MAQFNFGSNAGANTSQSGIGFGAAKPAAPTFGSLGGTQPSGSITFGTPIASVAPTAQNTGLSFGTPTLGGTSLNFGTPTPAPQSGISFGTPNKPAGLNFGTPTSQPTLNFGTPATSQPAVNFGATPTAQGTPGLSFGGAATSAAPNLSFGTPATSGGLSFGAPAANTGFGLGGTSTSTASAANPLGGINFGATSTINTPGGLNFGTPTSNTNPNPLGGINFGTPASSAGLTLGAPTSAAPGLSFGAGTPTASTGLNFGLGGSATSAAPTLNFKSSFTPASTNPSINFGFNAPAKTQTTTTLTLSSVPSSAPIGLGGVDSSQLKTGTVATGRTDTVAGKENNVPNEILQSIESFKQFVKDQKGQSSDISRGSARPFVKVREDIDLINSILTEVGNDLLRNQQQADKLKHDSAKCLHNAEMAQRTNDTPPGLQFENTAPLRYFIELVNQFEQDLQALRVQIDVTDKHFHSLHETRFLTSQELSTGMRRLHDTFVALAGRLHSVHTQVESQKEQYLNLRKYILKDPTNIFIKPASKEEQALDAVLQGLANASNNSVTGPTPFSAFSSPYGMSMMPSQQTVTKPPPAYPSNTTSLNFGAGTSGVLGSGANQSLFGNMSLMGQPQGTDTSGFQLQNPPPGNKRGKR